MMSEKFQDYAQVLIYLIKATGLSWSDISLETGLSYQKVKQIANKELTASLETIRKVEKLAITIMEKNQ